MPRRLFVNMTHVSSIVASSFLLAAYASAQQFPLPVTYDTIIQSPIDSNITISYKRPSPATCATAFETQKQYSGYVNLPPFTLAPFQQNYSINTFFWFFESRVHPETAPLTIWLNGGPGSSSMVGLFQEMGPCELVQLPNGTYVTQPRLWGWDRSSNILFIDQPTQTGFSFDERVNASVDLGKDYPFMLESREELQDLPSGVPAWRFMNGTFASGRWVNTQNTSAIAARACWHFLQGFLSVFPQYNPGTRPDSTVIEPTGVNLFLESYGGLYGPTFADFFESQNDRRRRGELLSDASLEIRLESVGILNGVMDTPTASIAVANFTRSNTYGITAIDLLTYQNAMTAINAEGGCRDLVGRCRGIASTASSDGICSDALDACNRAVFIVYDKARKSPYDIRFGSRFSPGEAIQEYLNDANVMQSIGAQVNFTQTSMAVFQAFSESGDAVRVSQLASLAKLLERGIRIAFIYGDADIICNWYGGQNASIELARLVPAHGAFPSAGYADIIVNTSYVGGHVRQFGNLSFSRVFDAGHFVPMYQPETAFTIFSRIIQGDAISMGHNINLASYKSEGLADSSSRTNAAPTEPALFCWIRDTLNTCTQEERKAISQGQGAVNHGVWSPLAVAAPKKPSRISSQFQAKTTATSSLQLTGIFTATALHISSTISAASRCRIPYRLPRRATVLAPTEKEAEKNKKAASLKQRGLIGGLGAASGILLIGLLVSLIRCCCKRSHKKELEPDEEKPPATFTQLVDAPPLMSRRPNKMESIPEISPRPSQDFKQLILSTLRSSSIMVEDQPPSRRPTSLADVKPAPKEQPALPVQRSVEPEEPQVDVVPERVDDIVMPVQRLAEPDEPRNMAATELDDTEVVISIESLLNPDDPRGTNTAETQDGELFMPIESSPEPERLRSMVATDPEEVEVFTPAESSAEPEEAQSIAVTEPQEARVITPIADSEEPQGIVAPTPPPNEPTPPSTPPLDIPPLRESTPSIPQPTPLISKPAHSPPREPTPPLLEEPAVSTPLEDDDPSAIPLPDSDIELETEVEIPSRKQPLLLKIQSKLQQEAGEAVAVENK